MCRDCNGSGLIQDVCGDTGRKGMLLFCDCSEGKHQRADEHRHQYPQPATSADLLNDAMDNLSQSMKAKGMVECWTCDGWFKADGRNICPNCRD